jgi:DNA modification methylase
MQEVARVLKPDGHAFVNIQVDTRDGTITPPTWIADAMPIPWKSYIVWSKGVLPPGAAGLQNRGRFAQTWEPVLHFSEEPDSLNGSSNFAVWDIHPSNIETEHDTGDHPAPFPVELVRKALTATTEKGDTILDPFMGSGTTAVAAIQNDRDYVGFELDEEGAYKPIIERRIGEAKRQREASVNQED